VGLHPDEPSGDIAQVALAHRVPFAIVPCCVFAPRFPERTLSPAAPVRRPLCQLRPAICCFGWDFPVRRLFLSVLVIRNVESALGCRTLV
jgi:hypothetical protein